MVNVMSDCSRRWVRIVSDALSTFLHILLASWSAFAAVCTARDCSRSSGSSTCLMWVLQSPNSMERACTCNLQPMPCSMLRMRWCRCTAKLIRQLVVRRLLRGRFVSLSSEETSLNFLIEFISRIGATVWCRLSLSFSRAAVGSTLLRFIMASSSFALATLDLSIVLSRSELVGVVALRRNATPIGMLLCPTGLASSVISLHSSAVLDAPHFLDASRLTRGRDLDLRGLALRTHR